MKNKTKLSMLTLTIASVVLVGCSKDDPKPNPSGDVTDTGDFNAPTRYSNKIEKISLDKRVISLFCNDKNGADFYEEGQFKATVYPKSPLARKIVWTSSDPKVAVVDENGKVKATGEGSAEITCASADGTVSDKARVVVSNTNGQRISLCKGRLSDIFAAQQADDFVAPKVVTEYETYRSVLTINGVVTSETMMQQRITVSKEKAFLDLEFDQQTIRVEDGSPVPEKLRYTFYTTDQFETFLFKSSGKVKNYASINQSFFMGQDKIEALKAVCDQFFVSGSKILSDTFDAIFNTTVKSGYLVSTEDNPHYSRGENAGQLAFDIQGVYNEVADRKDEEDNYIPYGTNYQIGIYLSYLFENNLLSYQHRTQSYTYYVGEDLYVRTMYIDDTYEADAELDYPVKENYSKVDSAFDL